MIIMMMVCIMMVIMRMVIMMMVIMRIIMRIMRIVISPSFTGAVLAASPVFIKHCFYEENDEDDNNNEDNDTNEDEDTDDEFSPYIRAASLSLPAWKKN